MAASLNIGFIGAGTLGKGLALALAAASYRRHAVAGRTYASAEELAEMIPGCRAVDRLQGVADQCDVVFLYPGPIAGFPSPGLTQGCRG